MDTHAETIRFFKVKGVIKRGSGRAEVVLLPRAKTLKPKVNLRDLWQAPKQPGRGEVWLTKTKKVLGRAQLEGNPVSGIFRRIFEHPKIKSIIGAHLAILTFVSALVRSSSALAIALPPGTVGFPATPPAEDKVDLITRAAVVRPLATYEITQGFSFFHPAIDLAAWVGEPIHPIMGGVVTEAGWSWFGYGNTVVVNHGNGYTSRYAHLSKIWVMVGDSVTTETVLGLAGATGHATGPHLHLEITDHGMPVDPRTLLE